MAEPSGLTAMLEGAIALLAGSATWRAAVGAGADTVQARQSIWVAEFDGRHVTRWPIAVVTDVRHDYTRFAVGHGQGLGFQGEVQLRLLDRVAAADDPAEALRFAALRGGVLDDLAAASGVSDAYDFSAITLAEPPSRVTAETRSQQFDLWQAVYRLQAAGVAA